MSDAVWTNRSIPLACLLHGGMPIQEMVYLVTCSFVNAEGVSTINAENVAILLGLLEGKAGKDRELAIRKVINARSHLKNKGRLAAVEVVSPSGRKEVGWRPVACSVSNVMLAEWSDITGQTYGNPAWTQAAKPQLAVPAKADAKPSPSKTLDEDLDDFLAGL